MASVRSLPLAELYEKEPHQVILQGDAKKRFNAFNAVKVLFDIAFSEMPEHRFLGFVKLVIVRSELLRHFL